MIARNAFASWLRSEREGKGLSLDDIARITKIQMRALERLEDARFDELPADVFVRGFIRNYARVVGLDPVQALARYDGCGVTPGPAAAARARAMIETVAALAPEAARSGMFAPEAMRAGVRISDTHRVVRPEPRLLASGSLVMPVVEAVALAAVEPSSEPEPVAVEAMAVELVAVAARAVDSSTPDASNVPAVAAVTSEIVVEAAPATKAKRIRGKAKGRKGRRAVEAAPVVVVEAAPVVVVETAPVVVVVVDAAPVVVVVVEAAPVVEEPIEITIIADEPTAPVAVMVTPPRSFRTRLTGRGATVSPTLIIDDNDPDSAEREQEARRESNARRSFLPPALLDGDRGSRQGGLTLAVIILLIVATLTLSYLMRRPSSSGEGVTSADVAAAPLA